MDGCGLVFNSCPLYVQQQLHSHVLCTDSRVNATVAITLFINETAVDSCLFVKQLPVMPEEL